MKSGKRSEIARRFPNILSRVVVKTIHPQVRIPVPVVVRVA